MKVEKLKQYLLRKHTKETAKSYLYNIENYIAFNPKAKHYGHKDVVQYIAKLNVKYCQSTTATAILSAIKKYYNYLMETGQRNDHPCRSLVICRGKQNIQTQNLFTSAELKVLLNRVNRFADLELRNKVIISFLIYQGLTSKELVNLSTNDIDMDEATVYIKATTKTSRRILKLDSTQIMLLYKYMTEHRKNLSTTITNKLLIGSRGEAYTVDGINRMLIPLKHFFPERTLNATTIRQSVIANWLNEKNIALENVQLMAGQKFPSSTERYKRIDADEQRKWINKYHPLK